MRINARMDDEHARKLDAIKQVTGQNTSNAIKAAIDFYFDKIRSKQNVTSKLIADSGLIGCSDGNEDLSISYKEQLNRSLDKKHDHR